MVKTSVRVTRVIQACACGEHKLFPSRECFEPAFVVNMLEVFQTYVYSEYTSLLVSRMSQACACGDIQVFASREYLKRALVVYAQAFASQGCFKLVLVVNVQASPISRMFQTCACGINKFYVSRVSHAALVKNTQAFPFLQCSKQALVVGTQAFCLEHVSSMRV